METSSAWGFADHALQPMLSHWSYPYVFLFILALTSVLGLQLLRRVLMVPTAAELAPELARLMVDLGSRAPAAGAIESAVQRGIQEALAPIAEEFRRDIRNVLERVARLEAYADEKQRWEGRDRWRGS